MTDKTLATLMSLQEMKDLLGALEKAQECSKKGSSTAGNICDTLEQALAELNNRIVEDPDSIINVCPECGVVHDDSDEMPHWAPPREDPQA